MENELTKQLNAGLSQLNLNASDHQIDQILNYLALLVKWNKVYNLTAVRKIEDMLYLHILDSFSINPYIQSSSRVLDFGSGAGLPGIPLAIVNPNKQFVLLDSNGKKTRFINQARIDLKLTNIEVVHSRVEKYIPNDKFDCMTSRAFATIEESLKLLHNLLADDAKLLFMKSNTAEVETENLESTYNKEIIRLEVPGIDAPRTLAVLAKK